MRSFSANIHIFNLWKKFLAASLPVKRPMNAYLNITEPCHEDRSKMLPAGKGRFCSSCKKVVRDFSGHTYNELLEEFRQGGRDMCGRVNVQELRKGYVDQRLKSLRTEQLRNFLLALLLSFGISMFSVAKASAVNALKEFRYAFMQARADTMMITGTVTDKETKETLPFANVCLYSGDSLVAAVVADIDGRYKLLVDTGKWTDLRLKVTYVGFISVEIRQIPLKEQLVLDLSMQPMGIGVLDGIILMEDFPDPVEDPHKLDGSGKSIKRKDIRRMPK